MSEPDFLDLSQVPREVVDMAFKTMLSNVSGQARRMEALFNGNACDLLDNVDRFVVGTEDGLSLDYDKIGHDVVDLAYSFWADHNGEEPVSEYVSINEILQSFAYVLSCVMVGHNEIDGVMTTVDEMNEAIDIYSSTPPEYRQSPLVYMQKMSAFRSDFDE